MQEYGSLFEIVLNNKINNSNDQFKLLEDSNKGSVKINWDHMVKQILNYFTKEGIIFLAYIFLYHLSYVTKKSLWSLKQ